MIAFQFDIVYFYVMFFLLNALDLPEIKITYNPMHKRLLNVEHVEEQNL